MIFHRDAYGFPTTFAPPRGTFVTFASRHATDRAAQKGFVIPNDITMSDFDVVEVEIIGNRVNKMLIRGGYNKRDDIVMVVMPKGRGMFVKTAWLNRKTDTHRTLDKTKFARP